MDIVLHLGAHRCATTTLQRMMGQSHAALAARRIAYWGPKRTRSGLFHGLIGQTGTTPPWQAAQAQRRIALACAGQAAGGTEQLFVSEENMLGTMRMTLAERVLYPDAGDRVAGFARAMAGHKLTLALSIRSYDTWWASVLAFRLTRGGPLPGRQIAARLALQPRRWRDVITDLNRALPRARIMVWCHEDMAHRPNQVVDTLTGRRVACAGGAAHLNPMPGIGSLRAYLEDCGHPPGLIRTAAGRFMPFDADQRAVLRALYAEDRAWLARGADGLAIYMPRPAPLDPGGAEHGEGQADDAGKRRLA